MYVLRLDEMLAHLINIRIDNELVTVRIKVDYEWLVTRASSSSWPSMRLPVVLDDKNQIYIRTCSEEASDRLILYHSDLFYKIQIHSVSLSE